MRAGREQGGNRELGAGGGRSAGPAPKSRWKSLGSGLRAQRLSQRVLRTRGGADGDAAPARLQEPERQLQQGPVQPPQLLDSPGAPVPPPPVSREGRQDAGGPGALPRGR